MSFRDCIQTAIDSGRVSARKGGEALDAYDRAFERAKATGEPDGIADTKGADFALSEITSLKAAKRHQRIAEMQRSHEIYTRIMESKDPARALQEIVVDLEMSYETVKAIAMANLDRLMLTYKPKAGGLVIPTKGMDDVVRAAYGDVRSPTAKEMADAVVESLEMLRNLANMYGANIPKNENRVLFQTHDQVRVSAVSEDEWVMDHLRDGVLDWDIMRYAGKAIPEDEREEILRKTYQGIVNDGFDRELPAQARRAGLATRLNRDRFLYYRGAESYLAMQEKYGAGNFYEQTINMIDIMSKDISILKTFGPSNDTAREFTKSVALSRAAQLNNERPAGKKNLVKKMEKQVELFDDQYKIHNWHIVSADGNLAVQTFSTIRTLAVNALLGSSLIPNMYGDLSNARAMRRVLGMPQISVLRSYVSEWAPTKAKLAEAARSGIIFENAISLTQARLRYFGALDGPHWARRIGDATYRLGLAAHHTQVIRNAQGKQIMGLWADDVKKKFDDLPYAPLLVEHGVTPEEWDRFRQLAPHAIGKATFLRPVDLFKTGSPEDQRIAMKFSNAMQMAIRTLVPDTTLRSRRALGEFVDPNSVAGHTIRTLGSLLAFPMSIWFNQLERIAHAPGIRNKIVLGSKYAVWMTLAGAAIVQTRALVQGTNPFDMTMTDESGNLNPFWAKAVVQGGGLGIVGDLIFNGLNVNNSSHFGGNPTMEYLKKFHKMTLDNLIDAGETYLHEQGMMAKPGDELMIGADVQKFIDANVPDLWYAKVLWERSLSDEWMQQADPAGWERKQRWHQENYSQGRWWEVGGEPEAPRLETAVGG